MHVVNPTANSKWPPRSDWQRSTQTTHVPHATFLIHRGKLLIIRTSQENGVALFWRDGGFLAGWSEVEYFDNIPFSGSSPSLSTALFTSDIVSSVVAIKK